MKKLLSGNEAIAKGAYEAGVLLGAGYPGTPSTEILENLAHYDEVYCEWSPNEKVALEVASGSSFAGARSLATMKHVGLNVAADPLLSISYSGVKGGLVIVSADDPGLHSSQNEQDNRHFVRFAKIPMLEPSDSQEAYEFTKVAFDVSEKFDTPVLLRTTTRVNHSKSLVFSRGRRKKDKESFFSRNFEKFVLIPAYAARRHQFVEDRLLKLSDFSDDIDINRIEWADKSLGVITSGVSYQYVKEVLPKASVLKIGFSYPIPERLIREFAAKVKKVVVIEELDPFLEEQIKALGIKVKGKDLIPITGELSPDVIKASFKKNSSKGPGLKVPARPPSLCPGCPHRGVFEVLRKLKLTVTGDIGCYTLGVLAPLEALDTCICMGAGVSQAHGIDKVLQGGRAKKTVAVIGDSTFFHSGVTALMNIAYNKGFSTIIVLDNRTTAMTGKQPHPGTGKTLKKEETRQVDIGTLGRALGIRSIRKIDPYKKDEVEKVIREEVKKNEPSLIITTRPCLLLKKGENR